MVLGTAELGMDYGVNNATGKPSRETAHEMLDRAWKAGIRELDTASAYGDSERVIGEYMESHGHYFRIGTKCAADASQKGRTEMEQAFDRSLERLGVDSVDILYMHAFGQCKSRETTDFLIEKRDEGRAKKIGISIYDVSEMEHVLANCPYVDVVQFPYSILDCGRWNERELLSRAKEAGKRLYVRSVFLQGLLFCRPEDERVLSKSAARHVRFVHGYAKERNITIAQLAYGFVQSSPYIDEIILGCETAEQMDENIRLLRDNAGIDSHEMTKIIGYMAGVPKEAIDPRTWHGK